MKDLLKAFKNKNTRVESETVDSISINPEFSGITRIYKGNLSACYGWYARTYESNIGSGCKYVALDDYDIHDVTDVTFNGIVVDDLNKLVKSLQDSGLKSLADDLEIKHKEVVIHISKCLQNDRFFKFIYGENALITNSFTDAELLLIKLDETIANYNSITINTWYSKEFMNKVLDETTNTTKLVVPTLTELLLKRAELTID